MNNLNLRGALKKAAAFFGMAQKFFSIWVSFLVQVAKICIQMGALTYTSIKIITCKIIELIKKIIGSRGHGRFN